MIEIKPDNFTWDIALLTIPGKCWRKTNHGRYEAFISDHSKYINIGTYDTTEEADNAVFEYRANRLIRTVENYGLDINDSVVFMGRYLAFREGMIFNIHGRRITGGINRDGYIHGIINGQNIRFHRIIASLFCKRPFGCDYVNHIDGNKQNNHADNLEWVTPSYNVKHAYENGLERKVYGELHHNHKLTEDNILYIKSHYVKRDPIYGAVAMSKKFNVDRTTIHDIIRGKTWRNLYD